LPFLSSLHGWNDNKNKNCHWNGIKNIAHHTCTINDFTALLEVRLSQLGRCFKVYAIQKKFFALKTVMMMTIDVRDHVKSH
jgi:hypothetical protein